MRVEKLVMLLAVIALLVDFSGRVMFSLPTKQVTDILATKLPSVVQKKDPTEELREFIQKDRVEETAQESVEKDNKPESQDSAILSGYHLKLLAIYVNSSRNAVLQYNLDKEPATVVTVKELDKLQDKINVVSVSSTTVILSDGIVEKELKLFDFTQKKRD